MTSTSELRATGGSPAVEVDEARREDGAVEEEFLVHPESDVHPMVSVVMPTLNEEGGIAECVTRILNAFADLEVPGEIIVSDASTDRTPEIASAMGARVVSPDEPGYGYAYRYGFRHVRGDYVVIGDADTTYDFEELPRLLERMRETNADMVLGSRLKGEIKAGAMPVLHKYVGNPLLTRFLNAFYDVGVSDAHSGFRVITTEALASLELETDGMEFASEMIMEAGARGLRIEEVPIVYHEREGEAKLDSFRDGWRHVRFMLENAPGYLFTWPAIGLGVVGVALMLVSFVNTRLGGVFFGTHTVIAGSLLTILGYQIGSLSIFSSVATDPIRSPADPVTEFVEEHFQLEHGATIGVGVFGVGSTVGIYLLVQWVNTGLANPPFVVPLMVAFTAVILGVQTVFYSFFLSMLGQQRRS